MEEGGDDRHEAGYLKSLCGTSFFSLMAVIHTLAVRGVAISHPGGTLLRYG